MMDHPETEEQLAAAHAAVTRDWREWERKSLALRRAALLLHEQINREWVPGLYLSEAKESDPERESEPDLNAPRTMLNGMAIESLIKGIWVRHHDPFDAKGKYLLGHHKPIELLRDLGIFFHEVEEELLIRLESYVIWAGKYPTAMRVEHMLPQQSSSGMMVYPAFSMHRTDEETFRTLFIRLRSILDDEAGSLGEPGK